MALPNWFVCVIGIGIVFLGLVCLVFICMLTGYICRFLGGDEKKKAAPVPAPVSDEIPNKQDFIAAVSAALAEELGADVSAIRILSVKRI